MRAAIASAVTLVLSIPLAGSASAERIYSKKQTRALLERILMENIVPFWYPGTIDKEHGGYRLNHDAAGQWLGPADKALVTQARTTWFFSRLHDSRYGRPEHLEAARHGFRFLKSKMWDPEHGGFFWSVTDDGSRPVEDQKHLYGQGFGLYALAEYIRASKDPEAIALARELFALLEAKAHDDEHGGFAYSLEYGWDAERGGFFYMGPFRQPADLRAKSWWVQAEGMVSALYMYRLTGDEKYYAVFEKTLKWIADEQVDWEHGDWHAMLGGGPPQAKAGPWKSPYHNGRAVLECLEILDAMD